MNIKFRYIFEDNGAIAPDDILKNEIWIDVGNITKDGVFDYHQDGGCNSAFESIIVNKAYFKSIQDYIDENNDNNEVIIHVHEIPDTDCIFTVYAVKRMIEERKEFPTAVFSEKIINKLTEYINKIDSGCGKYLSKPTLYAYFCQIGSEIKDKKKRSQEILDEGLYLAQLVIEQLENTDNCINLFEMPLTEYINVTGFKYYSGFQNSLDRRGNGYIRDKDENRVFIKLIKMWNTKLQSMQQIKAAIWEDLPSEEDEYIFAREDDHCLLTIYPYQIKDENSVDEVTRVVIALNPNMEESKEYSLLSIAEVIEQCEQIEEELAYEQSKRYRRDHSRSREDGRFSMIPFRETSDPWYISELGDIIDSPRVNSIIPYNRIISIVENSSFLAKQVKVLSFINNGGRIEIDKTEEYDNISYGSMYNNIYKLINEMEKDKSIKHRFVFIKIDPSMLRYSNNWLKACCLNMVGKSDSKFSRNNILQIDYRTCLYTDQSITILAAVDKRNQSLSSLVNDKDIFNSRILLDLKNIIEHQLELRNIGISLSETIQTISKKEEEIEKFSERLVKLNTRIEEDDLIADPLEQEVYFFIKDALGIERLKDNVDSSARLLISNAEQLRDRRAEKQRYNQTVMEKIEQRQEAKRDGRIQAGIGLMTIFAIFSAWNDAFDFIAKIVPNRDGGWLEIANFPPVLIIEIVIAILILIFGGVACKYVLQAWHASSDNIKDENNNLSDN